MEYEKLVELLGKNIANEVNKLSEEVKARISENKTREILKVLDEEKIDRSIIKTNGNILALGQAGKIREILKALDDIGIGRNIVVMNGDLLAKTNGENIKNIYKILVKYNLENLIEKNPNVLKTNSKNVEQSIRLYDREQLIKALNSSPSKLYNNSYIFILSRINYLKEQKIPLKHLNNLQEEAFNKDIFIATKEFEEKYKIDGKTLKYKYGKEPCEIKEIVEKAIKEGIGTEDIRRVEKAEEQLKKELKTKEGK